MEDRGAAPEVDAGSGGEVVSTWAEAVRGGVAMAREACAVGSSGEVIMASHDVATSAL